ncbi:MAG TPA: divalent-cation tolerance protein CutA [Dokdonella sp.]
MSVVVVQCSCPDAETAARIAQALVDERLAACVQVLPGVVSTYRWQGKVEVAHEVLLLAKTSRDRIPALEARLLALHPYELPELIVLDAAGGLDPYLRWIEAESAPP